MSNQNTSTGVIQFFIHMDTQHFEYAITEDEMARLAESGENYWKDFCLVCGSVGVPCFVNFMADTPDPFIFTKRLLYNLVLGVVGIVLSIAFGIAWYRTRKSLNKIINAIKQKPKMMVSPTGEFIVRDGGKVEVIQLSGQSEAPLGNISDQRESGTSG